MPGTQATQAPPAQTLPVPHAVPSAAKDPLATHTDAPVEHDVRPSRQGLSAMTHDAPALHAPHTPARQTRPEPQEVPSATEAPESTQVAPGEHVVVPVWQGASAGVQASPAVH